MGYTLAQEYLIRNKVDIPPHCLIRHVDHGSVFMKSEKEGYLIWNILQIDYKPDPSHPGIYDVKLVRPMHNAMSKLISRGFETLEQHSVAWDEYENHLYQWALNKKHRKISGMRVVSDPTEVTLTAWEIFAYCCDSYLASYAHVDSLCSSLDLDNSLESRHNAYKEFSSYLANNNPSLWELWNRDISRLSRNYCEWLAQIAQ